MRKVTLPVCLLAMVALHASAKADVAATQPDTQSTQPFYLPTTTAPAVYYNRTTPANYHYSDSAGPAYPAPTPFEENRFDFSVGGQGFTSHGNHGDESIGFVTFDFDYYFADTVSVGLELGLAPGHYSRHHHHFHDDDGNDDGVRAAEELVLFRWHFLNAGPLSLFIDGGAGGLQAWPAFPSGGRKDNFLAAGGGGVGYRFDSHLYGSLGARATVLNGGEWDGHHGHHTWSDGLQYYGELTFVLP